MSEPCDSIAADLLALDGPDARAHAEGCAVCGAHARIARALADVGAAYARPPDAVARAVAQLAPPRRRWLRYAAPAFALAAAIALAWWLRREPAAPRFAVEIVHDGVVAMRGDARLGDRLRVRARAGTAVWVYRNDRELLLACPRDCARDGDAIVGERVLDAIGRYQVVWLSAAGAEPTGELERDVAAAAAAGASHELVELVVE